VPNGRNFEGIGARQTGLATCRPKCLIEQASFWPRFKRCQWVSSCTEIGQHLPRLSQKKQKR